MKLRLIKIQENRIPGTETVLGKDPPSTPPSTKTVPVTVPVSVLVREPETHSRKASSVPKNIENIKNKEIYFFSLTRKEDASRPVVVPKGN